MKTKRQRGQNYFLLMLVNWSEGVKISQVCSLFLPTICSCCLLLKPYMRAQSIHSKTNLRVQFRRKPKAPFQLSHFILICYLTLEALIRQKYFLAKISSHLIQLDESFQGVKKISVYSKQGYQDLFLFPQRQLMFYSEARSGHII